MSKKPESVVKEKVYVDVLQDETGNQFYFLGNHQEMLDGARMPMANVCSDGGYFLEEDDLNEFLEENADELEVVKDYRSNDE